MLYISGSSSKLSSQEVATSLRGRTITKHIFPLSFEEYLKFQDTNFDLKQIEYSERRFELKKHFNQYLKFGGYPEAVLIEDENKKTDILREYFSTVITRDLIERKNVKKPEVLENFMKLLVNNFSRLISFSKAENWMNSIGIKTSKSTLIRYFKFIKESYFLFDLKIYSRSVKDRQQHPRKIYVIDNGYITALTDRFSKDKGWFYENLVASQIFRETVSHPSKEFYYWKNNGKEVDFVIKEDTDVKKLIQVCSNLGEHNKDREIGNLVEAAKEFKCEKLLVLTDEKHGEEEIDGKTVKKKPLWLWLLERN